MTTSICALIPTYNRASMIRECIDSVLAQTRPVQQIVVINDGSTDNTREVVEFYGDRVSLINKTNGGKSSALNIGLQYATADYIWVCDDDDIAAPDGLQKLAAALDADSTVDFAYGMYRVFRDTVAGRRYFDPPYGPRPEEPKVKLQFLEGMFTNQFAMLVRRALYEEVGPFREDLIRSQDYDMAIRLSRRAKSVCVPHVIFYYREHQLPRGSSIDNFAVTQSQQKWFAYDRMILKGVKDNYQLEEFRPSFAVQWEPAHARRTELVQRSLIFAMHGLWQDASEDLVAASGISAPLTKEELHLISLIPSHEKSLDTFEPAAAYAAALCACSETSTTGHAVLSAAFRTLPWRARQSFRRREFRRAFHQMQVLFAVLGFRGACLQILKALVH